MSLRPASGMQKVVAANDRNFGIGKKSECIACLLAELLRNIGRIYANGYRPDTGGGKLLQVFLDASQLEVTEGSPISPIENQEHGFWWRASRSARKQLRKGNLLSRAVGQREVRHVLTHLWCARRSRNGPGMEKAPNGESKKQD